MNTLSFKVKQIHKLVAVHWQIVHANTDENNFLVSYSNNMLKSSQNFWSTQYWPEMQGRLEYPYSQPTHTCKFQSAPGNKEGISFTWSSDTHTLYACTIKIPIQIELTAFSRNQKFTINNYGAQANYINSQKLSFLAIIHFVAIPEHPIPDHWTLHAEVLSCFLKMTCYNCDLLKYSE